MKPTRIPTLIAAFALAAAAGASAQTSSPAAPQPAPGEAASGTPAERGAGQPGAGCERYVWRGEHRHHAHYRNDQARYVRVGERWFGRIDGDRDGQVSLAELQAAQQRQLNMFERADTDRDGKVSREEFRALRLALREEHRQKRHPGAGPAAPGGSSSSAPNAAPASSAGPDPEIYHRG